MNDPMDVMDYRETVSVRLTRAQVERLRQQASALGISQSDVLRRWIDDCDAEQEELVFADLTLAWLQWLEGALQSDPHFARDVADALHWFLAGKPPSAHDVLNAARFLKTSIEAYRSRVSSL